MTVPRLLLLLSLCATVHAQFAPLKTVLQPQTEAAFQTYVRKVETEIQQRWSGQKPFQQTGEDAALKAKLLAGDIWVAPGSDPNPLPIADGLIHDWLGAVYIPRATIVKVLAILQDFGNHSRIYPQVAKSRLLSRGGGQVTGFWRLEQKGQLLPSVFDVTQTVHYTQQPNGGWTALSHADDIRAVEDAGSRKERVLPPGEGIGLMWKLYSYWTLQSVEGGVLAECRTLSLSRGLPNGVAWMVKPFLNAVPHDSMESTLRCTRSAATE